MVKKVVKDLAGAHVEINKGNLELHMSFFQRLIFLLLNKGSTCGTFYVDIEVGRAILIRK